MRVLVNGDDVHVWHPIGNFTIHQHRREPAQVTWHTPRVANREYASEDDDGEVCLPPRWEPVLQGRDGLIDAVVLDGERVALATGGDVPRVDVVEAGSGRVALSVELRADGPRLPGLEDRAWGATARRAADVFIGRRPRTIRLSPARDGFWITASGSGHVARYSLATRGFDRVYRVPAGGEHTLYAATTPSGFVVGIKWNGRHSEILRFDEDGGFVEKWPRVDIRWGMPAPAVLGAELVTYSDEGPDAGSLALIELATMRETDHIELSQWPVDLHGDGARFASVSTSEVAVGRVADGRFVTDRIWTIDDAIAVAGVPPPPPPLSAADDGRGERTWLPRCLALLARDGDDTIVVAQDTEEIVALRGGSERILVPGQRSGSDPEAWSRAARPRRKCMDARDGKILWSEYRELVVFARDTGAEARRIEAIGEILRAYLVPGGVAYVEEDASDDDACTWCWVADDGEERELSRSASNFDVRRRPAFAVAGDTLWWFEPAQARSGSSGALRRWLVGSDADPDRVELDCAVTAIAVDGAMPYLLTTRSGATHVERVRPDDTLERMSRTELPPFADELIVIGGQVAFSTSGGHGDSGRDPAKLYVLRDGEPCVLATGVAELLSSLQIADDRLWWLESADLRRNVAGSGTANTAAVCCVPLPL